MCRHFSLLFCSMLAGSGMSNYHRDVDGMGLEYGHHHQTFQFPPPSAASLLASRRRQHRETEDETEDPAPMPNRERSISAPNVSHTIMSSEAVLPESVYRHCHRDLRSKYIQLTSENRTFGFLRFWKWFGSQTVPISDTV